MLTKAICWGETREQARKRLVSALNRFHMEGIVSNVHFANAIINHPAFVKGHLSTRFIEDHFEHGKMILEDPEENRERTVIAATLVFHNRKNLVRESLKPMISRVGQIHEETPWTHYVVKGDNHVYHIRLMGQMDSQQWEIEINDHKYSVKTPPFEFYRRRLRLEIDGETNYFLMQYRENFIWVAHCGLTGTLEIYTPGEWELARYMPKIKRGASDNLLVSPMPGLVVDISVKPGERVYKGQDLVVIESMKMEAGVASPRDGVVGDIHVESGQAVDTGDAMITFSG